MKYDNSITVVEAVGSSISNLPIFRQVFDWLRVFTEVGNKPEDSAEIRTLKGVLSWVCLATVVNAVYFSFVYSDMGRVGVSYSLAIFGILMMLSWIAFTQHKSLIIQRNFMFTALYIHIITYHVMLGGYVGSSSYISYAIIVMVGAHLYFAASRYYLLFIYLGTGLALYLMEPALRIRVELLPESFRSLAMFNDFVVTICFVFFAVNNFASRLRKDREIIRDAFAELEISYEQLNNTQSQLIQAEKMASLGRLSSGLAHEIRNPINFVNNFAEVNIYLLQELEENIQNLDRERRESLTEIMENLNVNLERIQSNGKRADAIVSNMVQHASSGSGEHIQASLNELVQSTATIALNSFKLAHTDYDAELLFDLDPELPQVNIAPQEIARAIVNILDNAFKATVNKPDAHIIFRTKKTEWNDRSAVLLEFQDNGPGVPADILENLFEPFFTTSTDLSATGLGLSLSYGIVVGGHGGNLEIVDSDEGACFALTLPASATD